MPGPHPDQEPLAAEAGVVEVQAHAGTLPKTCLAAVEDSQAVDPLLKPDKAVRDLGNPPLQHLDGHRGWGLPGSSSRLGRGSFPGS
eukprot:12939175-Prorocentrum_lima.AAC.1